MDERCAAAAKALGIKSGLLVAAFLGTLASPAIFAADDERAWESGITAYPTIVRGSEKYTLAIALANRGPLPLEASVHDESPGARQGFVGSIGATF